MRPSAGDVARAAGVSRSQVSNYFNHPDLVSTPTSAKIRAAVDSLGYVRSASARMLRSGTNHTIGLMLLEAWDPYYALVSRGVEDEVDSHGWDLHFTNTRRDPARELQHLDFYEAWKVRGVIIAPQQDLETRLLRLLERGTTPVLLDPPSAHHVPPLIPTVTVDHIEGGRMAARHLVSAGCRRFAFVGNPRRVSHTADRLQGYREGLRENGIRNRVTVIEIDRMSVGAGTHAAEQVLSMPPSARPDAIMASNDEVALGFVLSLISAGVAVPDDVRVVGYDDLPLASQVAIPLTTIRQPAYDLGRTAARLAVSEIEHRTESERRVTFQPELVRRSSA